MGLESRWKCASLGIICILAHCASSATAAPVPLSVTPSTKWLVLGVMDSKEETLTLIGMELMVLGLQYRSVLDRHNSGLTS